MAGGIKHDHGKLRLDLIPPEMHEALGQVLTFGAGKYGDRNWEEGISEDRLYAAAERHLQAHRKGEALDPESGLPHICNAFCNIGMMCTLGARADAKPSA